MKQLYILLGAIILAGALLCQTLLATDDARHEALALAGCQPVRETNGTCERDGRRSATPPDTPAPLTARVLEQRLNYRLAGESWNQAVQYMQSTGWKPDTAQKDNWQRLRFHASFEMNPRGTVTGISVRQTVRPG